MGEESNKEKERVWMENQNQEWKKIKVKDFMIMMHNRGQTGRN